MVQQVVLVRKGFRADVAHERLLGCMNPLVCGQRCVLREGFGAGGALVGLFPSMDALVLHKAVVATEGFKANIALVGLLPRVGPHMSLQMLRMVEQLGTEGAGVLPESVN